MPADIVERQKGADMTLADIIAIVNTNKPSEFTTDDLTRWINEVEAQAADQVFKMIVGDDIDLQPYDYNTDAEKTLLIPDQFHEVYTSYLYSKIDQHYNETARYNNDASVFEAEWQAFASYYRRKYRPMRGAPHATSNIHYSFF